MAARVVSIEEYERRILSKLLREAGVNPEPIVERFVRMRDGYAARLIERLSRMEPEEASRAAQKLLKSQNPLDKTLGAWLAYREPPPTRSPTPLYL
ncbi:MAG: hypothetical protein QXF46_07245 [Thermofilaceae archaeon]